MQELIIDNFAGGGGASTGIEQAIGRPIDIAINHDRDAIAMHKVNHPNTKHLNENVWDVDPVAECNGRPVGLAWFSPDCTHFSRAKGAKPVKKKIRGLAWVVLKWAKLVKPRIIMLENVQEFTTWGPLVKDDNGDHYPCPNRKGQHFNTFIKALEKQGYQVEWKTLIASDYGAPTIRKRLFMVARCDGLPIVWPAATHGDPKKHPDLKPWKTAAECIDFSLHCPSIFERKKELAESTKRRIAKGIMKFVVDNPDPFIVTYYGDQKGEFRGQDIKEPLRTQTTENRHALVTPYIQGISQTGANGHYGNDVREPIRTVQTKNDKVLVSPTLIQTGYGEKKGQSPKVPGLKKPLGTVVAGGSKHAVVSTFIAKHYTGVTGQVMPKPLGTVTSVDHHSLITADLCFPNNNHSSKIKAFLIEYYGNGQSADLKKPLHTVTSHDRFGLVTIKGEEYQIIDIGLRMLQPRELFRAQGFNNDYIIDRDATGKPTTKKSQVARCGNAVPPPFSKALVEVNYKEQVETNESNRA